LKIFLSGEKNQESYARIALQLDMSAAAVKVAVYRLRQRYRELLRGGNREHGGSSGRSGG
jgi:DNA-directed RNA polymerase specialized sigma24 family protein